MSRVGVSLLMVVVALSAAAAFWWLHQRPRDLAVVAARVGPAAKLVYATGVVEPKHPVSVSSRLTAPVQQVLVDEGDRVRRGQALILLDDRDQRGLLAQADAQLREAVLAERRVATLFDQGWSTRAARDNAVATADAARAGRQTAAARVGQSVVRAGIDGMVLKRDVEPGDTVSPGKELLRLGDPRQIQVSATVDERDLPTIRVGQDALLSSDAWPGRVLHGRVRQITPGGEPDQRAFRVRLTIRDPQPIPIGMTFEVNIVVQRTDRALLVPIDAIAGDRLWIVEDGRAVHRAVAVGIAGRARSRSPAGSNRAPQ